jgi:hypothetical protein
LPGTLPICIVNGIQGSNSMASYIKGAAIKDEKVVIYANASNISFWSASGLVISAILLLPLFGIWLILWLVLHTLKTRMPAYSAARHRAAGEPRQDHGSKRA